MVRTDGVKGLRLQPPAGAGAGAGSEELVPWLVGVDGADVPPFTQRAAYKENDFPGQVPRRPVSRAVQARARAVQDQDEDLIRLFVLRYQ